MPYFGMPNGVINSLNQDHVIFLRITGTRTGVVYLNGPTMAKYPFTSEKSMISLCKSLTSRVAPLSKGFT